jgi:hypothetical protein
MTDILTQLLLSQQGLGGDSSGLRLDDRLSEIVQADPRVAPLVQRIRERLAAKPGTADIPSNDRNAVEAPKGDLEDSASSAAAKADLKALTEKMSAELDALRARNDMLATALGACHLCWGEDSACSYCGGAGCVGGFVIDAGFFEQVVGPALRQLNRRPRLAEPRSTNKDRYKGGNHGVVTS